MCHSLWTPPKKPTKKQKLDRINNMILYDKPQRDFSRLLTKVVSASTETQNKTNLNIFSNFLIREF